MKHIKAFGLIFFLIFSSIFIAPKSYAQLPAVDSTAVVDSIAIKDSLARLAVFDSLDISLKIVKIILFPDKGINYLKNGNRFCQEYWKARPVFWDGYCTF
ncbi:hypothetical protein [Sphingobacterium daejeonense]|uniref:hypothetical protein n=1 Tax=Sphingobacterium daejeonense TaxID=371142 RepID=UPI0010C45604|nr:hypothetical protein [Sphingobacterium daejeonense]VTQ06090.1 Uncharacterised protein [Sphingobacterium daejeonense]